MNSLAHSENENNHWALPVVQEGTLLLPFHSIHEQTRMQNYPAPCSSCGCNEFLVFQIHRWMSFNGPAWIAVNLHSIMYYGRASAWDLLAPRSRTSYISEDGVFADSPQKVPPWARRSASIDITVSECESVDLSRAIRVNALLPSLYYHLYEIPRRNFTVLRVANLLHERLSDRP